MCQITGNIYNKRLISLIREVPKICKKPTDNPMENIFKQKQKSPKEKNRNCLQTFEKIIQSLQTQRNKN